MASSDEQLVKNSLLFISVRENIPFLEKLVKVRRYLDQGADVNGEDGNDGGNTPLHVAARRGEEALADLLINKGADVTHKNWNGQTPLEIAQALHSEKDIVDLLQSAESSARDNVFPQYKKLQTAGTSSDLDSEALPEFKYLKRSHTSGLSGQLYETKLLSLLLMRALNDDQIEHFLLGTNIYGIGNMDDICLRFQVKGHDRPVVLFMEARHRADPEKRKLIVEDLQSVSGDFSLQKFFESYLMIKDRFQANNEDPMFEGEFGNIECNFVIYTPAKDCFAKKNTEHQVNDRVHYLINTRDNTIPFQYDYNEDDIQRLYEITVTKQLEKLGADFLNIIMSEKYKPELILSNKIIARYHVVIGREVLQPCDEEQGNNQYRMWKFRPQFFVSNCEYLLSLKRIFIKVLSTKCLYQSKITNKDRETIEMQLSSMKFKLPLEFGNLDMKFRGSETKVLRRMKAVANKLIYLFEVNKHTNIIEINDNDVGPGKLIERSLMGINGGIGSAVGNLLVFDPETKMLKFDLDNEALPYNAAILYKELKYINKSFYEKLSSYRIKINMDGFPKCSFNDDEYDKIQTRDFLSKLWFYTNQAKENEVESLIKYFISKLLSKEKYNNYFNIRPDIIFLKLHDEIQKWWNQSCATYYLSSQNMEHLNEIIFSVYNSAYSCIEQTAGTSMLLLDHAKPELKYRKRIYCSAVGHLYETKMLSLVNLRALNDEKIEHFLLGTNIRGIGAMDDICLRYRMKDQDKPVVLFMQVKYRADPEKRKLTVADVRSVSGDFSLQEYFNSYLMIKNRFQDGHKDPMFEGDFGNIECNLVIYTPAKDCFTKKNTERQVSDTVHYLINTTDNTIPFQYDYDEDDIENLTKITVKEQLKNIGAIFLEIIMSEKDKSGMVLADKLIARYHVIMGREVLQQCEIQQVDKEYRMWEFRPQFFESNCEYLITLRKSFIKELSTKYYDQSKITNVDRENLHLLFQTPCATTISKLIGKTVLYNDKTKKLELPTVIKNKITLNEFKELLIRFNEIEINEYIISKAIEIKLSLMKIKLPQAFGNLDITFRGNSVKVQKRMKTVADKLITLFEINKHTNIADISNDIVGPGKTIEQGFIDINGGIGGAVGNLLVFDSVTKMLKFDLDNKLPSNAALFLEQIKETRKMQSKEELSNYRIKINIDGFPKDSFVENEYEKKQAKDFLNKLWFYTNQAEENKVEIILKENINQFYNKERDQSKLHPDAILLRFYDEMEKWRMQLNDAHYLSCQNRVHLGEFSFNRQSNSINPEMILSIVPKDKDSVKNLYVTKLICLIYIRGLKNEVIENLRFENDIRGIGDMDYICLRYRVIGKDRPVALLVQAKYYYSEKQRLTVEDVNSAPGNLKLWKYFESYLMIKNRFRSANYDPLFEGDFRNVECKFIIYTPAKDYFSKKNTERQVSDEVHYLINTGDDTEAFQYDYDEDDIQNFTKLIVVEQLKKLGVVFLKIIMSEREKSESIMTNNLLSRYHVIMGQEVLQQCKMQPKNNEYRIWEFRPEFFESSCEYLIALKTILIKELSAKRWDLSKFTDEDRYNFELLLNNTCAATISKSIGKIVTYNDKTKKIQLVEGFSKKLKGDISKVLQENVNEIVINEDVISKAIEIKLLAMKIKLPLLFGNLDMAFRGNAANVKKRIKFLAHQLVYLCEEKYKYTNIVDITDIVVGPGKMIEQGFIEINGGIGSAVGNLLVLDPETKMLKLDLDNEALPHNAAIFVKELKYTNKPFYETLSSYRIKVNVDGFPKCSLNDDEYDKRQTREFLSKLWFYTNQAQEYELKRIVQHEINSLLL